MIICDLAKPSHVYKSEKNSNGDSKWFLNEYIQKPLAVYRVFDSVNSMHICLFSSIHLSIDE